MKKEQLKKRVIHDIRSFLIYFTFFTLFFWTFTMYRRLILDEYHIGYLHYSYNFLEAFILAKLILIGQAFKLGERFSNQPLIIPTLYKTIVFSIFVLAFTIIEEFALGSIKGENFEAIYTKFIAIGFDETIARVLVMFFVFIPFFAFLEIGRIMGDDKLYILFAHKQHQTPSSKGSG